MAIAGGDYEHRDGAAAPVDWGDLEADLVAGDDGAAETGVLDAGEGHEALGAVGELGEEEAAAGLGDGLDHEDAGHDGEVGEVALEEGLVDGDVVDGYDALLALDFESA